MFRHFLNLLLLLLLLFLDLILTTIQVLQSLRIRRDYYTNIISFEF